MSTDKIDKATPRPWAVEEVGVGELFIVSPDGKGGWFGVAEMSRDAAFKDANLIVEAINSYNPERDQLARELAFSIQAGMGTTGGSLEISEAERDLWRDKAGELLKLYKEKKP
ncbi:hypothetical protein LCGC14_1312440 [marine sediment metagenome]|uniref:Uncharacterized protein n=1 Tax=marine sediment metagenome TaxID=412755 RepID=A0A0F9L6Y6_9ZZZZ